jgi:hypothetical protein
MPVTYVLGKDCTITGVTNTAVRSVTATAEGSQIDATARGATARKYLSGWKEATVEIVDSPPAAGATLTIAAGGLSGSFVVTSVAQNQPLDDIVTYNVTCKMKQATGT